MGVLGPAGAGNPLHAVPVKGIFTPTTGAGSTITVSGGSIGAAAPRPGDTVVIAAGTYPPFTPRSGAPGAYVTYAAAPGAQVVISGGLGRSLVDLDGASWVHLDGLTVADAPSFGIYGSGPDHIAMTRVTVAGAQDGGLVILGGTDVYIDGCDVHAANSRASSRHEALTIGDGTTRFEVLNCLVHDNRKEGIDTKYGANDGIVHGNAVWANKGPNIYVDSVHDVQILDNWTWGATGPDKAGIMLGIEAQHAPVDRSSRITVARNTIWGNAGGAQSGIRFWIETTGSFSDVTVEDNVFADGNAPPTHAPTGVTLSGNVTGAVPAAAARLSAS